MALSSSLFVLTARRTTFLVCNPRSLSFPGDFKQVLHGIYRKSRTVGSCDRGSGDWIEVGSWLFLLVGRHLSRKGKSTSGGCREGGARFIKIPRVP